MEGDSKPICDRWNHTNLELQIIACAVNLENKADNENAEIDEINDGNILILSRQ